MKRLPLIFRVVILAATGCALLSVPGNCTEQKKAGPAEDAAPADEIKQFCTNNAANAGNARIALQASRLLELEGEIKQRLAELEARKTQLAEWLQAREEAMKKARDEVIAIYGHMRPDAAASHLAAMEDAVAAAILAKLPPRTASAILNEMDPARAAQLTNGMVAPDGKKS